MFVSHSSKDKEQADAICAALEANGLDCWIAPRNIRPGHNWDEAIVDGIAASRVMLLIHSANANKSDDVAREIAHASDADLPVLPLRLENVPMSKSLRYHLVQSQWLDAFPQPLDDYFGPLVDALRDLVDRPAETTGTLAIPARRVLTLRDLVALGPLVALDVLVGTWVTLNARWAVEWVVSNVAIAGSIALLWKLLPNETTERARQDFARTFSSRKVAGWLAAACAAFIAFTGFVSTVRITAVQPSGNAADRAALLPATIVVRDDGDVAESSADSAALGSDTAGAPSAVRSVRLAIWGESRSAFLPIVPLGRSVRLDASPRHQTPAVKAIPWLPRALIYPADFEAPALAVLPLGSLVTDIAALPRVVVYAERESGRTVIADVPMRSMGAILFSAVAPPAPDSITRARWSRALQSRVGVDEQSANEAVGIWTNFRWVKTRHPLTVGDRLRVIVVSRADTLASDTLTLTASATDVYLTRRP